MGEDSEDAGQIHLAETEDVTSDVLGAVMDLVGLDGPMVVTVNGRARFEIDVRPYAGPETEDVSVLDAPKGVQ